MTIDRRALLATLGKTSLLAPLLATVGRAAAQHTTHPPASGNPSLADQQAMAARHQELMEELMGDNLWREEQIAMLLYPGLTALDLVGPHYFFACLFGAKVHLVTTGADLAPVPSDSASPSRRPRAWRRCRPISTCCSCPAG